MSLIGRIFVIIFAVMVASMAAGIAIAIGVLGPQWHGISGDPVERFFFWGTAFIGATGTGAIGILPLAIMIVLAEAFKIRSLLINAFAGLAMMLIGYYGSGFAAPYAESIDQAPPMVTRELEIAAAAGVVFGLIYWLIAGRNAGRWRERAGLSRPGPAS